MAKERFSRLKFKVHELKEPVLKKYPQLLRHKSIAEAKELKAINEILTYIILMYDPESDLLQECPDLKDRKTEACALAGLKEANFKEFQDKNPVMMGLINCFITEIYHNRKHREWLTAQEELDYFTRLRWDAVESKEFTPKQRVDLNNLCDSLNDKLDRLEEQMSSGDKDVRENIIADRWSSPEKYASPTYKLINN